MEENNKVVRTRRIGSVTFGVSLILFGVLFLGRLLFPALKYTFIFHLWPVIFIMLGLEILIETHREGIRFVYDKAAIFMMVLLLVFVMCIGAVDWCMSEYEHYWIYAR